MSEENRAYACQLGQGNRFILGEVEAVVKRNNRQHSMITLHIPIGKGERDFLYEELDGLFPNGIPLTQLNGPHEWEFIAAHFDDGDGWSWNGWKPGPWMESTLDPAKKYDVTISERAS